jgi:hypothetical protein
MKTECNVARDLMPLRADGVASEESGNYIDAHIAQCTQCKTYFEGMMAALPAQARQASAREQAEFAQAAEELRKKHVRRVLRSILLGVLLGALVMAGLYVGWVELTVKYNAELPKSEYGVSLAQLENGKVVVSIDYRGSKRVMGTMTSGRMEGDSEHPGGLYSMRIWMETTILPQTMVTANRNGPTTVIDDIGQYDVIRVGEHSDEVFWQKGDPIPKASPEMEAYYAADDQRWDMFLQWYMQPRNGEIAEIPQEAEDAMDAMAETVEHLRLAVPEWQ